MTVPPTQLPREKLLGRLEEVSIGLSSTGIVEQTQCFVFKNGRVYTFSGGEVTCQAPSGLPKALTGAVDARKVLDFLKKFKGITVTVKATASKLILIGKNEKAGVSMDREILLPVDELETPTEWQHLPEDFTDAVGIVGECASKDQELFTCTCVHIHPKWMEAFDNAQMTRYRFATGADKAYLVRRDSLKYLPQFDFTHFALTGDWAHFRTKSKTVLSCKRYVEESADFQDLTPMLKKRGKPTSLPKSLADAAEKAEIPLKEDGGEGLVTVLLRKGSVQISGHGQKSWYKKVAGIKFAGPNMKFRVAPKLLMELIKRNTDCEISEDGILRVDGGKFTWCVCLEEA